MSYLQEAVREWAWVYGAEHPDHEWLCSDLDSWEKNPHYTGPKGRHPEDDRDEEYGPFLPAVVTGEIPF